MDEIIKNNKTLEEKINDINNLDEITLKDTIQFMSSDNYKERLIAEYMQTKIRYNNLHKMIVKLEAGTLDFKPTCPTYVLTNQKSFMDQYLKTLEIRAEIEGIKLPNI